MIWLSIAAALLTLFLKFTAYFLTGSVGLFSDALESLINLAAAVLATLFLTYAARPADSTHTYGHDKAEYLSSGVEGTLIVLAAIGISYSATKRMLTPMPLENLDVGLLVAVVAALVNFVVARILLKAARDHDSITLEADAKHLMTDVWSSVGVVGGLVVVGVTGFDILDPIIAYLVAGQIVFSGVSLLKRSIQGLMDYALPPEEVRQVESILRKYDDEIFHYHNLRSRKAGPTRFIDFHILVAGDKSVQEAHDLCEELETDIESALSNTQVTIHVEPVEDASSWDAVSLKEK